MTASSNFTNQFLIAMPGLEDPNFFHSVTYICEHGDEGAMGIVINQPSDLTLRTVLEHMQIEADDTCERIPVFNGGPVQPDRGFVLHPPGASWSSSVQVADTVAVTTSRDILEAMARHEGPEHCLVALGYAGWGAGQLEQEIAGNAWLTTPADPDILFTLPAPDRWQAAATRLGIDLSLMSGDAGHA
jgi:putative transcriptional regulator